MRSLIIIYFLVVIQRVAIADVSVQHIHPKFDYDKMSWIVNDMHEGMPITILISPSFKYDTYQNFIYHYLIPASYNPTYLDNTKYTYKVISAHTPKIYSSTAPISRSIHSNKMYLPKSESSHISNLMIRDHGYFDLYLATESELVKQYKIFLDTDSNDAQRYLANVNEIYDSNVKERNYEANKKMVILILIAACLMIGIVQGIKIFLRYLSDKKREIEEQNKQQNIRDIAEKIVIEETIK